MKMTRQHICSHRHAPPLPVALDEHAQLALLDQTAFQIIQPKRLAACLELPEWVHVCMFLFLESCCFTASNALPEVKPNLFSRSSSGAEEPKARVPHVAVVLSE